MYVYDLSPDPVVTVDFPDPPPPEARYDFEGSEEKYCALNNGTGFDRGEVLVRAGIVGKDNQTGAIAPPPYSQVVWYSGNTRNVLGVQDLNGTTLFGTPPDPNELVPIEKVTVGESAYGDMAERIMLQPTGNSESINVRSVGFGIGPIVVGVFANTVTATLVWQGAGHAPLGVAGEFGHDSGIIIPVPIGFSQSVSTMPGNTFSNGFRLQSNIASATWVVTEAYY